MTAAVKAVAKGPLAIEGRTKRFYEADRAEWFIQEFTDQTPQGQTVPGKGIWCAQVSAKLFQVLESKGIPTHFERVAAEGEILVKRLAMIPLQVTIRNRVAGTMAKSLNLEEGAALAAPVFELHYKAESLSNPLVNESHVLALQWATEDELKVIRERSTNVSLVLAKFFEERAFELIDLTLEFGRFRGKVLLGDEISPDTLRLWERGMRPERDLFHPEFRNAGSFYREIAARVAED